MPKFIVHETHAGIRLSSRTEEELSAGGIPGLSIFKRDDGGGLHPDVRDNPKDAIMAFICAQEPRIVEAEKRVLAERLKLNEAKLLLNSYD